MKNAPDVMSRRCRLIDEIQRRGPITRDRLAATAGSCTRTIERDIDWLESAGVPITRDQQDRHARQTVAIPKRWNAARWLWQQMTAPFDPQPKAQA